MRKFSKILALLLAVCLFGGVFALFTSADSTVSTLQLSGTGVKPGSIDENFKGTLNLAKASKFHNGSNVDGQTVAQDYGYYNSCVPSVETNGDDRYLMFTHKGNDGIKSANNYLRLSPYGKWTNAVNSGYTLSGQVIVTDFDMTAFDVDGDGVADAPTSLNFKQVAVATTSTTKVANKTVGISIADRFSSVPGEWVHITVVSFLNEEGTHIVVNVYANGEFVGQKDVNHAADAATVGISFYNLALEGDDVTANTSSTPRFQIAFDHFTSNFYSIDEYETKADEGSDLTLANLIADPANAAPLYLYKDLIYYYENYDAYNLNPACATVNGTSYKILDAALANVKAGQHNTIVSKVAIKDYDIPKDATLTVIAPDVNGEPGFSYINKGYGTTKVYDAITNTWTLEIAPADYSKFPVVFKYNDKIVATGFIEADKDLVLPGFFSEDPASGLFTKVTSWVYDNPLDYEEGVLVEFEALTEDDLGYIWANDGLDYDTLVDGSPVALVFTAAEDAEVETLTVAGYAEYALTDDGVAILQSYSDEIADFAAAFNAADRANFMLYAAYTDSSALTAGSTIVLDANGNLFAASFTGEGTVILNNVSATAKALTDGSTVVYVSTGCKFYGTDLSNLNTDGVELVPANVPTENGDLTAICSTLVKAEEVVTVTWYDGVGDKFQQQVWYAGSVVTHPAISEMSDRDRFPLLAKDANPYYGWCDTINGWAESGVVTTNTDFYIQKDVYLIVGVNLKGIMYNVNIDTSFDIVVYAPIYYVQDDEGNYVAIDDLPAGIEFTGITGSGAVVIDYAPVGTTADGRTVYAPAAYKRISMRKLNDTFAPAFNFTVNGESMSYTMPAITLGTYANAVYAQYPGEIDGHGSPEQILVTAMLNYAMSYEYDNLTSGGYPAKATYAIYAAVNSKQNDDDPTPGAHHNCACQDALKKYTSDPYATEKDYITDDESYILDDAQNIILGFTMDNKYNNEPAISVLVDATKVGSIKDTAGQGLVNAFRYSYIDYKGELVSNVSYIKGSFGTGGWDEYIAYNGQTFLQCKNIYIVDTLSKVTIELLTCTEYVEEDYANSSYEVLATAQYSIAEYYQSLVANQESDAEYPKYIENLTKLYALAQAARAYRLEAATEEAN